MTFRQYLKKSGACRKARAWARTRTSTEAWNECTRPDWLAWWVWREGVSVPRNTWARIIVFAARRGNDYQPRLNTNAYFANTNAYLTLAQWKGVKKIKAAEEWLESFSQEEWAQLAMGVVARSVIYAEKENGGPICSKIRKLIDQPWNDDAEVVD